MWTLPRGNGHRRVGFSCAGQESFYHVRKGSGEGEGDDMALPPSGPRRRIPDLPALLMAADRRKR